MKRIKFGLFFTAVLLFATTWTGFSHEGHSGNDKSHTIAPKESPNQRNMLGKSEDSPLSAVTSATAYRYYDTDDDRWERLWTISVSFAITDAYYKGEYCLSATCPHKNPLVPENKYGKISGRGSKSLSNWGRRIDDGSSWSPGTEVRRCSGSVSAFGGPKSSEENDKSVFAFVPFPDSWDD
jgi:hypothetical protein